MTNKRNMTLVGRLAGAFARASGHVLVTVEKQVETLRTLERQAVEHNETQARLSALNAEFESALQELQGSRSAEVASAAEMRRLEEALGALSRERDEQCAALQAGLSNMRAGYEGRVKALETDIVASRGAIVRAREAMTVRLSALQGEYETRIASVRASLDEARAGLHQAQEDKQKLGAQIEDERRSRQEEHQRNEAALTAAQAQIRTMQEKIDALDNDLKERVARVDFLASEISNARAGYEQRILGLDKEVQDAKRQAAEAVAARDAATSELARLRASVEAMRLPAILIVSVVKSGTVFTRQALAKGLGVEVEPIGFGYFPRSLVELPKLKAFSRAGNKIGYSHVDASEANLQILSRFLDRWVVHIRDPRSVLLSWVHHMNRLYSERNNDEFQYLYVSPAPPDEYYGWPVGRQIDWNIDNFLPNVVTWTRDWLRVVDAGNHDILLTNYSELIRDDGKYLTRILDFYGIPRGRWSKPVIAKTLQESHFRTGTEDEWMTTFTPGQIARANAAIDEELFVRFGWLRGPDTRAAGRGPNKQIRSVTDQDR